MIDGSFAVAPSDGQSHAFTYGRNDALAFYSAMFQTEQTYEYDSFVDFTLDLSQMKSIPYQLCKAKIINEKCSLWHSKTSR